MRVEPCSLTIENEGAEMLDHYVGGSEKPHNPQATLLESALRFARSGTLTNKMALLKKEP